MYDREIRPDGRQGPERPEQEYRPPAATGVPTGGVPYATPEAGLDASHRHPGGDTYLDSTSEAYRDPLSGPVIDRAARLESGERVIELREEELVARKDLRELGEVEIRTEVEEVPSRLEVEAYREEVEVEHVPVGEVVSERLAPWEEEGILVVPVYEEQLVLVKRLVMREKLRIRRVATTETRLFEDKVRRERLIVEDPDDTGLIHERYPTGEAAADYRADTRAEGRSVQRDGQPEGGFFENLVRKALQ